MSLHNKPEHNTPPIVEALKEHGLKHDGPSQLADAFRLGYRAALASKPTQGEQKPGAWRKALEHAAAVLDSNTGPLTRAATAKGIRELLAAHPEPVAPPAREAFEDFANRRYAPKGYQPEREGDGYKEDAWQLAWEAWADASQEMADTCRAYELLFKENGRHRDALEQAIVIIDGALFCGHELNANGEEKLQRIRAVLSATPPAQVVQDKKGGA